MAGKNSKSIKSRFIRFITLIFLLIFVVILLSNLQSYESWLKYKRTFTLYDNLSRYYDQAELMNVHLKNFIYMDNKEEYLKYLVHYSEASSTIEDLKSLGNRELQFRFGLLGNMLDTYHEKAELLLDQDSDYNAQQAYDSFNRLMLLINETYPTYSKLITSTMNREKDSMLKSWKTQMYITILLFLTLLIVSMIFSIASVRGITRPIDKLISNINRIKGGTFQIRNIESDSMEIRILLAAFEEMAENLNSHIEMIHEKSRIEKQLIEKENENLKITKLLTETRLNALQGQMNPHFLYNTLSMISKQAYIEGAEKTSDLMVRTAELLRYSLDMSTRASTLDQEIKCVQNYLNIQERRIGKRINLSFSYPRVIPEVELPGMTLQPLIENSFIHGVGNMVKDARINILIKQDEDWIIIIIEDNGKGIPPEILSQLNNNDEIPSHSIGISNVKKRLHLYFQDNFQFRIESTEEVGSVIQISIPLRKGQ